MLTLTEPPSAPNLLARVRRLLRHKNWETRVAAANAVDAICKRMPVWDPSSCKTEDGDGGKSVDPLISQGLQKLDIKGVIERGQTLVSSTGTEFDDITDSIADPKERLAAKKQQLRAALGLDSAAGGKMDGMAQVAAKKGSTDLFNMQDVVKDEDVEMHTVPETQGKTSNKRKASDILDDMQGATTQAAAEDDLSHLSARERNQLRRKQRKMQREGKDSLGGAESKTESKSVVTSQPQDSGKVVVESTVAEVVPLDPNEWPLGPLCDDLSHDIFDACWEIRHGAAMALRDILKYHAAAAGKWAGTTVQQQTEDNQLWLEECTIRMLCVLSLDRFGDYVSDPVVAPVRETCAQGLGVLLRSLNTSSLGHVTRVLHDMQSITEWEVRHGGMLGLKYLIAVRKECVIKDHLKIVLPLMRAAIEGEDDDVRSVSAEALLPLAR
jgi:TATA-binding protein-associated factor